MNAFAQDFFEFTRTVTAQSRFRLAPTPSGFLHQGNAINFVLNWLAAKWNTETAKIYLRIDDLDTGRTRPEYLEDIFATLSSLQIDWDEAPIYQSANLPFYHAVLDRLRERDMLFACRKSRQELELFGNVYPPEFRDQGLSLDASDVAWRIKTPPGFVLQDFVVRRRDGIPAYQVASFADDLCSGITHIIRGEDLKPSTAAQQLLAKVLSEDKFLKINFLHHPLVLGERGEKLSKSAGSTSLKSGRDNGAGVQAVFQQLTQWLGLKGNDLAELQISLFKRLHELY